MDRFVSSFSRGIKKPKIAAVKVQDNVSRQSKHQQMYIDLGQKLFGKSKECSNCGMVYVIGDVDDERRHDQNCAKAQKGPVLASLKGHRILSDNLKIKDGEAAIILEIRCTSGAIPDNIQDILRVVENELGSSPDYVSQDVSRIYLYILEKTKTVIGCLVAEEVQFSDLVELSATVTSTDVTLTTAESRHKYQNSETENSSTSRESSDSQKENREAHPAILNKIVEDPEPIDSKKDSGPNSKKDPGSIDSRVDSGPICLKGKRPCSVLTEKNEKPLGRTLGVRQIWVHKNYRRNNIARSLVDIGRQYFIFGTIVLRSQVAYSQPTSDGLKFSLAYSKQDSVYGYA